MTDIEKVERLFAEPVVSLSTLVTSLHELDADALDTAERQRIIALIVSFAQTAQGPDLILSLPASWLAELHFAGTFLPGIDASAYQYGSTRQILTRMHDTDFAELFADHDFSKATKTDWALYLVRCDKPMSQCLVFLSVSEENGGFSEADIVRLLDANSKLLPYLPIQRISPTTAARLLVSGKYEQLWDFYPFERLGEAEWLTLLEKTDHPVPEAGKRFLAASAGFSDIPRLNMLLARKNGLLSLVDPALIDPMLAPELLLNDPCSILWKTYDFRLFDRASKKRILVAPVNHQAWSPELRGMLCGLLEEFQDDEILDAASRNLRAVVDLIGVNRIVGMEEASFGKLCALIANDASVTAEVERFLKMPDGRWTVLPRKCQVVILQAMPQLRGLIQWCEWPVPDVQRLMRANVVFRREYTHHFRAFVWNVKRMIQRLFGDGTPDNSNPEEGGARP